MSHSDLVIDQMNNEDNCIKCDEVVSHDKLNREQICEDCVEDGGIDEDARKYETRCSK